MGALTDLDLPAKVLHAPVILILQATDTLRVSPYCASARCLTVLCTADRFISTIKVRALGGYSCQYNQAVLTPNSESVDT